MLNFFAMGIIVLWALMALTGNFLPLNPNDIELNKILHPPEWEAWLGYDDLGRPVLDRLIMGAQTSFLVALWVVSLSLVVGTVVGTFSAYTGGWVDHFIVRIIDILLAFPGILLAIALAGILGPGIENVIIAVQAAVALGMGRFNIIRVHLIPLITAPLIVEGTFAVAGVIISEAGLSYLGLGVQPPEASWGGMIRDGTRYMLVAPHMVIAPGLVLIMIVLAVNLLGDRIRDRLDVRRSF